MKKLFPSMMNCLGPGYVITIFVYWIIGYLVLPSVLLFMSHGLWEELAALGWIDMFSYAVNGICVGLILKEHLSDSFFEVQTFPKPYAETVTTAVMLMFLWIFLVALGAHIARDYFLLFANYFPLSEIGITMVPGILVGEHPIAGTLCLTLLVPFTVCGFFYATAFGPLGCKAPWLGYLGTAVLLLIGAMIQGFWMKDYAFALVTYLLQLPVHMIACWSYQHTDNLWTPIFSIGLINLISSGLFQLLFALG